MGRRRHTIQDALLQLVICEPTTLETGCWEWSGAKTGDGYGTTRIKARCESVHRAVYEHFVGPIPKGRHLHHNCENRACANFEHLQLLTPKEHNRISNGRSGVNYRRTVCSKGHPFNQENTYFFK